MQTSKAKKKQAGFTLVEVMISMAILVMLSLPLLTFFANSAKTRSKAGQMQDTTFLAESIMEEMKAYPSMEKLLANTVNVGLGMGVLPAGCNPSDSSLVATGAAYTLETDGTQNPVRWASSISSAGGVQTISRQSIYYLERHNVSYGDRWFDARIIINPGKYKAEDGTGGINSVTLPEIQLVDTGENCSASEIEGEVWTAQTFLLNQILQKDLEELERERESRVNAGEEDYEITAPPLRTMPSSVTDPNANGYVSDMSRVTKINISPKGTDKAMIKIWMEYSCRYQPISEAGVSGGYLCTQKEDDLVKATVQVANLKKMYLFFYHPLKGDLGTDLLASDKVEVEINGFTAPDIPKPDLYLVCQKPSGGAIDSEHWKMEIPAVSRSVLNEIYSNIATTTNHSVDGSDAGVKELVPEETTPKDRIAEVTVEIYDAGYLGTAEAADHLRTSFTSTRGN